MKFYLRVEKSCFGFENRVRDFYSKSGIDSVLSLAHRGTSTPLEHLVPLVVIRRL